MRRFEPDIPPSEITPESVFLNRRAFLAGLGAAAAALARGSAFAGSFDETDAPTPENLAVSYNNFFEYGRSKTAAAKLAPGLLKTRPWTVTVDGLVKRPRRWDIDALIKAFPGEERVYRFRCIEGWAMVVPWSGFELARLLEAAEPAPKARFVRFETLFDPGQMPGQKSTKYLHWPYQEVLRLDEARNTLALMATGIYGKPLPHQNGAPIRLVVPWKYGYKSIKSVVRITLTDRRPASSWGLALGDMGPADGNVDPASKAGGRDQSTETRLGEKVERKTLPYNGYAKFVAGLY